MVHFQLIQTLDFTSLQALDTLINAFLYVNTAAFWRDTYQEIRSVQFTSVKWRRKQKTNNFHVNLLSYINTWHLNISIGYQNLVSPFNFNYIRLESAKLHILLLSAPRRLSLLPRYCISLAFTCLVVLVLYETREFTRSCIFHIFRA